MAEFFPPVIFEITARAGEAIASFKEVNVQLAAMEKNGVLASGAMGKMQKAAGFARAAILGVGGAFAVMGFTSIEALDKVEKAQANLETAIKNTGVSFNAAKPSVDAHAKSMTALGFTLEDTYTALAKMTAASGSPQTALNALGAAADLSRFKQISLADAGTLLARASIGQAKGLGDLGIAMGKTIPKGATFAQILKMVEDRAQGAAKAFGETLSGKLAVARANFQALQVQIGTDLVPTLSRVTDWITIKGIPKFREFIDYNKANQRVFKGIAVAIGVIWAVPKIAGVITAIQTLIKTYEALRAAAATAAIATAFATGGVSVVAATAALAGGAAIYGGFKLKDILTNWNGTPADKVASYRATGMRRTPGTAPIASQNLAGKGVKKVTTPAKTKTTAVQQNITVYASNTNDIAKNLAKAAKNGTPIGTK
jgi:hypothetical protein